MNVLFSVIIPVYNAEKYLTKCINSVIDQNFNDLELIIIDDFSNDNTRKILKLYVEKNNNNIKVFFNRKNKGVAYTRNVGLKKSSGKYIIFLDSDDFLFKNTFRNLKKIFIKKKYPDVIFGKYKKEIYPFNNSKILNKSNKVLKPEDLIKLLNKYNFPVNECWQFIINKSFLDSNKIKFIDIKIGEDQLFVAEILTKMQSCACYNKFFYYHRNFFNSLSTSIDLQNAKSFLVLLVKLVKLYKIKLINSENKFFLEIYIQNTYGIVFSYLFILKKRELFILNSIFLKNKNLLMNIKKKPENISLKDIITKSNSSKLMNKYINKIFLFKKNQIMRYNIKYKYIFIYCTGITSLATINILKKIKLTPRRIIDDNLEIVRKKFYGIKISSLDQISQDFNIKTLNKSLFLVSNQRSDTFNKISKAILKLGCFEDQIIHIKF